MAVTITFFWGKPQLGTLRPRRLERGSEGLENSVNFNHSLKTSHYPPWTPASAGRGMVQETMARDIESDDLHTPLGEQTPDTLG